MLKRITQAPIRRRLPLMIVGALMFTIATMSAISYIQLKNTIEVHVEEMSETVTDQSIDGVQGWLDELAEEANGLAHDRTSRDLLQRLNRILTPPHGQSLEALRTDYIDNNPFPLGERSRFDQSDGGTTYDSVHGDVHGHFRGIVEHSGFHDLFVILPNGNVVYSVFKEDDFGTNVLNGRYARSGLGEVFRAAVNSTAREVSFSDFAPYAPSSDAPASFMGQAVLNEAGEVIGVVAIQLPVSALKDTLTKSNILGAYDEVYLIGPDGLARSESIETGLLSLLQEAPDLAHVSLEGDGTSAHYEDVIGIRGTHVDAYVSNFDVMGNTWTVVVERDLTIAFTHLTEFMWYVMIVVVIGILLSIVVGYVLARSVTRPLTEFTSSMQGIANGDLDTEITLLERKDEFGQAAADLGDFRDKLKDAKAVSDLEARKSEEQAHVVKTLGDGLDQLANGNLADSLDSPFSEEYEELRHNYNATIETMNDLMRTIVDNSNEINARAEEISASSDDLSHRTENQAATLEETAAALDELTASVREAAESASEVENVVTETRKDAEESGIVVAEAVDAMSMIRKSSSEISQIIGVIDDIAFQTNLLSLNAGVEAARAGDAGRGFAVVASEVRALAQRSSEAAKQIKLLITSSSEQVETGVGLVDRTGEALGSIIQRVSSINSLVSGIATGSREQASGLGEINIGMAQLDQVTQQNAAMVEEFTAAASTLRNESSSLTHVVGRFKLRNSTSMAPNMDGVLEFKPSSMAPIDVAEAQFDLEDHTPKQAVNSDGWTDF